ncbi:MAG: CpaF family protein [Lachnospiraceae bacterium]|nr:CpaF family protein [Lachnospiraceae bacterium]MCH4063760.1 CpaF family protein [Lachnospiraceae bacterium]MCH4103517.1 CpaF family protein [Lachnospiraceae bacterium]MCI1309870.1 CpaF family protein [Lachnospiraceae bacterium]MCI1334321.1 CpaF family protein [Lachnospiraceae bacterium]
MRTEKRIGMRQEEESARYECICREIRRALTDRLRSEEEPDDDEIRDIISDMVMAHPEARRLPVGARVALSRELFCSVRRLDILQDLIDDKTVTEIMVNGPDCIFIEQSGKIRLWDRHFSSREKLEDVVQQVAGACNRVINEQNPIVDARLADGSRVNAVIAPVALNGPILTIRQFPDEPITMEALMEYGSITREAAHFLKKLVRSGYSIVISGGTSAGKTTFLNALSSFIPGSERIITIEDNAELQIQGIQNLVRLEAKMANFDENREVTIRDLIKSALRMRPDRIIVGEVRSGEAVDMLTAFNTGHDGSLCTIHANSCEDAVSRLEMCVLMGLDLPLPAIRRQIASGVDIIIQLGRLRDRSRRVLEISEVDGMEGGEVKLHSLYLWDDEVQVLRKNGDLKHRRKLVRSGIADELAAESGKSEK